MATRQKPGVSKWMETQTDRQTDRQRGRGRGRSHWVAMCVCHTRFLYISGGDIRDTVDYRAKTIALVHAPKDASVAVVCDALPDNAVQVHTRTKPQRGRQDTRNVGRLCVCVCVRTFLVSSTSALRASAST